MGLEITKLRASGNKSATNELHSISLIHMELIAPLRNLLVMLVPCRIVQLQRGQG